MRADDNNVFGFTRISHPGPPPNKITVERDFLLHHECSHIRLRFVRRVVGRATLYGYQCLDCGSAIPGSFLGAKRAADNYETDLREAVEYHDGFTSGISEKKQDYYWRLHEARSAAGPWWDWYNAYLSSVAWATLRARIMDRDNNACCMCDEPADHVHHLTYERVGYENDEDLIAICRVCHEAEHGRPL
jgi:5-methylcytosine-specific restriction endonuclease McrA